ncbi:hypothetical protein [Actinophytocola sp. NPDC049390]|uniref:hypothetical protein n=1 Tax=Actinophytocola sp. NPDC049390 TaxID=3363894 RepID=UPI0037A7FB9C
MPASRPVSGVLGLRRCAATRCGRAAGTRARLCTPCRDGLATLLTDLPGLYTAVEHARTPGTPMTPRIAEARSATRGVLASWAHVVVGARAVPRPVRSVAELAGFLHRHVDWLSAHPAVAEIVTEIGGLAAGLRDACRAPRADELAA